MPDYPRSLDAMHEAEKVLDDDAFDRYIAALVDVVNHEGGYYVTATAEQRARAFCAAIS